MLNPNLLERYIEKGHPMDEADMLVFKSFMQEHNSILNKVGNNQVLNDQLTGDLFAIMAIDFLNHLPKKSRDELLKDLIENAD